MRYTEPNQPEEIVAPGSAEEQLRREVEDLKRQLREQKGLTQGTTKSVVTVASKSPPITARPSGAFCSPPSPKPKAMGSIPIIMAAAVMMTGRMRVWPAASAAERESIPSSRMSLANTTIRILLAVATPI